jgi:hypothetical protein
MKPFISTVGAEVIVVPCDYWQHVRSAQSLDYEFPPLPDQFAVRVAERFDEQGQCIGISGPIINGPAFLIGLIANCFSRIYREAWDAVVETYCNVLISPGKARRHTRFSHQQVEGSSCSQFPQYRGVCEIYASMRAIPKAHIKRDDRNA